MRPGISMLSPFYIFNDQAVKQSYELSGADKNMKHEVVKAKGTMSLSKDRAPTFLYLTFYFSYQSSGSIFIYLWYVFTVK